MNKPVVIEKIGNDVDLHALPRTHAGTARELPEVYYKNGKGSVDRVERKNIDTWFREARKGKPQAQYNLGVVISREWEFPLIIKRPSNGLLRLLKKVPHRVRVFSE